MAETRVLGTPDGNQTFRALADARAIAAETSDEATAEATVSGYSVQQGPFPPNDTAIIIQPYRVTVEGAGGTLNVEVNVLNSDGSVQSTIAEGSTSANAGQEFSVQTTAGGQVGFTDPGQESGIIVPTPGPGETFYVGVRTWTGDEQVPSYPSPSVAAQTMQTQSGLPSMGSVEDFIETEEGKLAATAVSSLAGGLAFNEFL